MCPPLIDETNNSDSDGEGTSLLVSTSSSVKDDACQKNESCVDEDDDETTGNASVGQTIVNIAKACMGPGCLVLPFAARQGGLYLHTVGLLLMATWNVYTIERLCSCLKYIPSSRRKKTARATTKDYESLEPASEQSTAIQEQQHPPEGTAMFGQVMWYALGPKGLWALDVLMLAFLLGILITYINAMRSFLRDTPLTTQSDVLDALLLVAIMGPLAAVPHMGYLAKASAMGLIVLAATFVVLAGYGLMMDRHDTTASALSWMPQHGLWGVSHWFGCVVFSFGVAPLTYNFRSSMARPSKMVTTAGWTLIMVAVANMIVGIGFWILFPTIQGDLLQELPTNGGILPSLTRIAMVLVVLTTTPLLIVPCGELLEGKALGGREDDDGGGPQQSNQLSPYTKRILFRVAISLVGVAVSLYVPGFVDVLSFVGCCCVACLGFTIPPFLHALLCYQSSSRRPRHPINTRQMILDVVMFLWGIFATVVSTTYTFRQLSVGGSNN